MLNQIVEKKRKMIERAKQTCPLSGLMPRITLGQFRLSTAIRSRDWALIAECKLASPVKGRIFAGTVSQLAQIYHKEGATALSVLTDEHFDGSIRDLSAVRAVTDLPILRKDFIIDCYQIYEARALGADAILLIAAILTDDELQEFLTIAKQLGLDCVVEVHSQSELQRVLNMPVTILGINNRNLTNFTTDLRTSFDLLPQCGQNHLVISESGIRDQEDALRLQAAGARGILVGEHLVTAENIAMQTRLLTLHDIVNKGEEKI